MCGYMALYVLISLTIFQFFSYYKIVFSMKCFIKLYQTIKLRNALAKKGAKIGAIVKYPHHTLPLSKWSFAVKMSVPMSIPVRATEKNKNFKIITICDHCQLWFTDPSFWPGLIRYIILDSNKTNNSQTQEAN